MPRIISCATFILCLSSTQLVAQSDPQIEGENTSEVLGANQSCIPEPNDFRDDCGPFLLPFDDPRLRSRSAPETPFSFSGMLDPLGSITVPFGPPVDVVTQTWTTVSGSLGYRRVQGRDTELVRESGVGQIFYGPRTDTLFGSELLSIPISETATLGSLNLDGRLGYHIGGRGIFDGISNIDDFGVDPIGQIKLREFGLGVFNTHSFRFLEEFEEQNEVPFTGDAPASDTTFGPSFPGYLQGPIFESQNGTSNVYNEGVGVIVSGLNFGTDYQRAEFASSFSDDLTTPLVRKDSFLFLDMDLVASINWEGFDCNNSTCGLLFDEALEERRLAYSLNGESEVLFKSDLTDENFILFQDANSFLDGTYQPDFGEDPTGNAKGTALLSDPSETRRYIFAAGGLDEVIDNPRPEGRPIDTFYLSAGMVGPVATSLVDLPPGMYLEDGGRALQRAETWTDLAPSSAGFNLNTGDLAQTPFYIVYPDAPLIPVEGQAAPQSPKLFYADMATAADGRVSSISAAIGEVEFRFTDELNGGSALLGNERIVDGILRLHSVGSSRGITEEGETRTSILISSDFESTAAGGGNPNIGDGVTPDAGRLGFFVLENAGSILDDVEDRGTLNGGLETAIGSNDDLDDPNNDATRFATLRLGVATGSEQMPARLGLGGVTLPVTGYAAAILETEEGNTVSLAPFGGTDLLRNTFSTENLRFSNFSDSGNSFEVTIGDWVLGGGSGESAYVTDQLYGARSSNASTDLALVSGGSVASGVSSELATSTQGYEHVKWGFFFGDTKTGEQRQHAHVGSFAAGQRLTQANVSAILEQPNITTAQVNYTGHMIGSVSEAGRQRTASGMFRDSFNFASRTGKLDITFDGRSYSGASRASGNLQQYSASIASGNTTGELNGHFIGPVVTRNAVSGSAVRAPAGLVGAFGLSDGAAGSYRAVGTFAGE